MIITVTEIVCLHDVQVCALLSERDPSESSPGRGVLEFGQRVQGVRAAHGRAQPVQARDQPEARLHRRIHQPGRRTRGRGRPRGRRAGLRDCTGLQPCTHAPLGFVCCTFALLFPTAPGNIDYRSSTLRTVVYRAGALLRAERPRQPAQGTGSSRGG